jgi:hypothetical protein
VCPDDEASRSVSGCFNSSEEEEFPVQESTYQLHELSTTSGKFIFVSLDSDDTYVFLVLLWILIRIRIEVLDILF